MNRVTLEDVMEKLEGIETRLGRVETRLGRVEADVQNLKGELQNLKIFTVRVVAQRKGPQKNIYWADTIGVGAAASGPTYLDPRILKD